MVKYSLSNVAARPRGGCDWRRAIAKKRRRLREVSTSHHIRTHSCVRFARAYLRRPDAGSPSPWWEFRDGLPFKELKDRTATPLMSIRQTYILSLALAVSALAFSSRASWSWSSAATQRSRVSARVADALIKSTALSPSCHVDLDTPRPILTSAGQSLLIDVRSVTARGGQVIVAGEPAYRWMQSSATNVKTNQFVAAVSVNADGGATIIPPPPGVEFVAEPRIVAAGPNAVDFAFGLAAAPRSPTNRTPPDSLMTARWTTRGWTRPARVPVADGLDWDPVSISPLIERAEGATLAFPISSVDSVTALLITSDASRARVTRVVTGGVAAAYMRLASLGRTLVMSWIGAEELPGRTDHNALFVARSIDGGQTWHARRRLEFSEGGASDPALVRSPDGSLFLLWARRSHLRALPDTLAAAVSRDSGLTWTDVRAAALPRGLSTVTATSVQEGALVAFRSGDLHIGFAFVSAGGVMIIRLDGPISVGAPTVVAFDRERAGVLYPATISPGTGPGGLKVRELATVLEPLHVVCTDKH